MSLLGELLRLFEPEIQSITLIPSDGGRFEVSLNGELIFSKLQSGRHPEPGEIAALIQQKINH